MNTPERGLAASAAKPRAAMPVPAQRPRGRLVVLAAVAAATVMVSGCGGGHAVTPPAVPVAAPAVIARGVVELPLGLFELHAPQEGSVASVVVKEGDQVQAGQVLLQMDAAAQRHDEALAAAELAVARSRLRAQQSRMPTARRLLERSEEAQRADAIEPQRVDDARQALDDLASAVAVAEAELALVREKLVQAQAASKRLLLTAPMAAQVLRVQVQPGARVAAPAGQAALMLLVPTQSLRVRAELNEAVAGRVQPGQVASVFPDGDLPAHVADSAVKARVVRLSPLFGASRLDPDAAPRTQVRVLDCYLEFDGPTPLRAGQAVRVEFL